MDSQEAKAHQLLGLLELHEESQEFLAPVDFDSLGIPMYPTIIKTPMDLGTIKKRLKSHHYTKTQEFIADVQLIWDNCKKFNEAGTEIHQQAVFLEKQTKRYCAKLRLPMPNSNKNSSKNETGVEDMKNVSFEEKWKMTEAVRKVKHGVLEKIVEVVKEKSPDSMEILEKDKIKIKLDVVTRETFNILQEIVEGEREEDLPQKRPKKA